LQKNLCYGFNLYYIMIKRNLFSTLLLAIAMGAGAQERQNFDEQWQFVLSDTMPTATTAKWRTLDLPHDWAIEGDFSASNPSGNSGGALPGGIGWYEKRFTLNAKQYKGKRIYIDFDGVYMNSTVWINGKELGTRPYGYSSFRYDLTPYIKLGAENVVRVKVDNSDQPNSRWYSGCGIYRHVWFNATDNIHVAHWGTFARTDGNRVDIDVEVENNSQKDVKATIVNTLLDARDRVVGEVAQQTIAIGKGAIEKSQMSITAPRPRLWQLSDPYIYRIKTEVIVGKKVVDTYYTRTGFRTFKFDADNGFSLNGQQMKLNGVCQHHDLGCLGAALNNDALHRQLQILKDMGTNAIRCSHNPPSPELLEMCDTMGLIVMDESFDMWRRKKTKNDYARFFDKWAERDLTDLVKRDRNHPSIMVWSIGNEVLEQWSDAGADTLSAEQANLILNAGHDASQLAKDGELSVNSLLTRNLCDIVRRLDTTRPITAGCNEPSPDNHLFKSGALDIIGFNYHHQWVKNVKKNFPGKPFIFSESVSALQTRDYYMMPSDSVYVAPREWWLPYTDPSFACSAYDNMHASWSSTHEETWDVVKNNPFVGGQFIWTGFDYIGEPTPYGFPARSSYFGIVDLAGFPKDVYYMYQSEWTDKQVLHLFPHWNWVEGDTIDMWCYYNQADEVELFINGKSQGVRRKTANGTSGTGEFKESRLNTAYHVGWRVKFEPGEVKVVARKGGVEVAQRTIRTAGAPANIRLSVDKGEIAADGTSMAFVTVEVTDKDGNLCPRADNDIRFDVEGIKIAGVDNGSPISMERFQTNHRKAFNGKCLVALRSIKGTSGTAKVTAKCADLKEAELTIEVK